MLRVLFQKCFYILFSKHIVTVLCCLNRIFLHISVVCCNDMLRLLWKAQVIYRKVFLTADSWCCIVLHFGKREQKLFPAV